MSSNSIKDALAGGGFSYLVELVASAKSPEAKIFQSGSDLARIPGVVGAGVTSYAGGSAGHDPIRIGTGIRARGLTPNVHITCVNKDRSDILKQLETCHSLGIENIFAITGDYPLGADPNSPPLFAMDSVQLVEMIGELRAAGMPFFTSVAVSPFKYTEADCAYQYLKLEKKIAAGADFAITQLGYDSRKFRELKRYLSERGLKTPVFGNVYVLPPKAAEKFSKGEPPGCWVSKELLERIQVEAKAEDKGMAARLERAARTVAILRGLGYAGAYIGGIENPERIQWIIQRSEEAASQWEEFAEEISYGPKGGFYLYETPAHAPKPQRGLAAVLDTAAKLFPVKHEHTALRGVLTSVMRWVDERPAAAHTLEKLELAIKSPLFGCKACGNCVLGEMEYVCPMTCPKNMRNGPCGGTLMGMCEVLPDKPCIWVKVYETAQSANRVDELKAYIPPRNRSLQGTSSFVNLFLERDSRPGHDTNPAPSTMIQIDKVPDKAPMDKAAETVPDTANQKV
ncbi:MAG TPA: methylenetetrahydrofolate reductase C-terminal domain-containing protein [Bryobacteraceae bacterium]|jgi:methylenetetrahydrofolate reductase (NADPH)|nr:methylenetetrahydrofolate reductase C-terminal domain-containing protein [Bryobacteraceae bacterium]